MVALKVFLSLAVAGFSSAFVPDALRAHRLTAIVNNPTRSFPIGHENLVVSAMSSTPETSDAPTPREVFPGVHLPENEVPPSLENSHVISKVQGFIPVVVGSMFPLMNQPKSSGLGPVQEAFIKTTLEGSVPNNSDYKFFGNDDTSKTLTYLLKTNPFFASALTKTRRGFELISFDRRDPDCQDSPSLFRKVACTLESAGHRVNFYFDSKMEITGYKVYDDATGASVFQSRDGAGDDKLDFWASSALYTTLFYAESVHATIHALHYLMTSGLQYVSEDFEPMHQWAEYYANNIQRKYGQVGELLLRDDPAPFQDPERVQKIAAVLTGTNGFGATAEVRSILANDLLNMWGQCNRGSSASSWLDSMMNLTREDMEKAGILTEFRKHVGLIAPFAKDATDAFREIDAEKTATAELRLKDYLERCGSFKSNIDSLEGWIELMSATGDLHGTTIGFTRLTAMADVMRWRNIKSSKWDAFDLELIAGGIATVIGMEDDRHVMTSTMDAPYEPRLQAVLDKFDAKATSMKEEYEIEIQKDPDFNDFGWIFSDYCTDGFDGKQMTTATYI